MRMLAPGPKTPTGFILTTAPGIAGAFLATFIGQAVGHYGPEQGAGFVTSTVGAMLVLFVCTGSCQPVLFPIPASNKLRLW